MPARRSTLVSLMVTVALALSLLLAAPAQAAGNRPQVFLVPLTGAEEVPARDTDARGFAVLLLRPQQETLSFVLLAFNIENVVFAHIHAPAAVGSNASPVVFLLHDMPEGGGPHNGLLSRGTLTEADLVGAFAGQDFSMLVNAIQSGNAYVNVHTDSTVGGPENTGAGNFRSGEIRGQID